MCVFCASVIIFRRRLPKKIVALSKNESKKAKNEDGIKAVSFFSCKILTKMKIVFATVWNPFTTLLCAG